MTIQIRFYLMKAHYTNIELREEHTKKIRGGQLDYFLSQATYGITLRSFKIYVDTVTNYCYLCWIFKVV